MKAFLAAVIAVAGLAWIASAVLDDTYQRTAPQAFTTEGVRLSPTEPNLVEF